MAHGLSIPNPLRLNPLHPGRPSIIPGFGLTMGLTVTYLSLVVLLPLAGLAAKSMSLGWEEFWRLALDDRTLAAVRLSVGTAFFAAVINLVFGILLAWVFTRYTFPGRRLLDALVDLPFALPTAVAGIALTAIYAPTGWVGSLAALLGWKIAYTPIGIVIALTFIGLPFVVRTVQPIIQDLDRDVEEASATLGAGRVQTLRRVVLPTLAPAALTGFALALARGIGEYGSVIFIAGNLPYESEIAPLLVVIRLEEFNYAAATAVGAVMLAISFAMLLAINVIQAWSRRRYAND
jgi:sulfate transport system permease protein